MVERLRLVTGFRDAPDVLRILLPTCVRPVFLLARELVAGDFVFQVEIVGLLHSNSLSVVLLTNKTFSK